MKFRAVQYSAVQYSAVHCSIYITIFKRISKNGQKCEQRFMVMLNFCLKGFYKDFAKSIMVQIVEIKLNKGGNGVGG